MSGISKIYVLCVLFMGNCILAYITYDHYITKLWYRNPVNRIVHTATSIKSNLLNENRQKYNFSGYSVSNKYSSNIDVHPLDEIIDGRHREMPFNMSSLRLSSNISHAEEVFGRPFNISRDFLKSVNFPIEDFVSLNYETMKDFVVVTAVSDNHVKELTGLIASVQKYLPQKRLHVYNIGLSDETIMKLSSYCAVTVVPFDFNKYPDHVRILRTYGFKPAVVHDALSKYPGVFWVDACQEFTTPDFSAVFDLMLNTTRGFAGFICTGHSMFAYTHPDMFKYFTFDIERIKPMLQMEASSFLVYRTKQMYEMFKPWFLCGMDRNCIAPNGSLVVCGYNIRAHEKAVKRDEWNKIGCHRQDQSALSLALTRTYGYQRNFGFLDAAGKIAPLKCKKGRGQVKAFLNNTDSCHNML